MHLEIFLSFRESHCIKGNGYKILNVFFEAALLSFRPDFLTDIMNNG